MSIRVGVHCIVSLGCYQRNAGATSNLSVRGSRFGMRWLLCRSLPCTLEVFIGLPERTIWSSTCELRFSRILRETRCNASIVLRMIERSAKMFAIERDDHPGVATGNIAPPKGGVVAVPNSCFRESVATGRVVSLAWPYSGERFRNRGPRCTRTIFSVVLVPPYSKSVVVSHFCLNERSGPWQSLKFRALR